MYTETYKKHLAAFAAAQEAFDAKPCKKTATVLSNLRETKFANHVKYTPEYMKEMDEKTRKRDEEFYRTIKNHLGVIHIERLFERGKISEEMRIESHKLNDKIHKI